MLPLALLSTVVGGPGNVNGNEVIFCLLEEDENLDGDREGGDMDLLIESQASLFVGLAEDLQQANLDLVPSANRVFDVGGGEGDRNVAMASSTSALDGLLPFRTWHEDAVRYAWLGVADVLFEFGGNGGDILLFRLWVCCCKSLLVLITKIPNFSKFYSVPIPLYIYIYIYIYII